MPPGKLGKFVLLGLLLSITACRSSDRATDRLAEDTAAAQEITEDLTLANITLNQADEQGRSIWQVKAASATYSPDRETATVVNPDGQLYQDGKPVFRVQGQRGTIHQNGKRLRLEGQIVATDLRSGAILKGNQLEWQPEQDLLVVRNGLTGTHPQIRASATEARVYSRRQRMELSGNVIALVRDPSLRMQAEHLIWQMDQQKVTSDRPAQIQQLRGQQTIAQAQSDRAEVDLKAKVVTLTQQAQLVQQDPPLQINSNALRWNVATQIVDATQPVTVQQLQQRVTVTADRGRMNLQQKIVDLMQNVRAVGQRNRSELRTDRLIWKVTTQEITADGNVVYTQASPVMNVRGPRAVGRLENQTIVLSGGRVETQIIPNP
jgi:LPS export ABC transporter protein LptC